MRTLLQQRQTRQLDNRERAAKTAEVEQKERATQVSDDSADSSAGADRVASEQLPALRKKLNALVGAKSARTGRPHGAIHNEVRRNCGGPPTALCSAQQLQDRIAYLRDW